jgi:N-acyl-D-aspartate/D-glutamate deacylase
MLDAAIRGGSIVDGTGAPASRADIGISGGRITSIGPDVPLARQTFNADGLVVAPGFIDIHTHYDAQAMWDRSLTPSSLHGATTVIGGNCGFTIAPVNASSREYVMHMLACVEGMPVESLEASLTWGWESFGEWLEQLDGRLALNTGFSVGHSTVRHLVMGEDWRRAASDDEIGEMERHIDASLDAGALGFSSSWGEAHRDHLGNPVPSRFADPEELIRLSARLRDRAGTTLEFIPSLEPVFSERAVDVMIEMALAAGRPLNWNVLLVGAGADEEAIKHRLSVSDMAAERGATVIALTLPVPLGLRLNLITSIAYNATPGWAEILALPMEQRLRALSADSTRARMAAGMLGMEDRIHLNFGPMTIESVANPELFSLKGRTVGDVAAERGRTPMDTFLDIAVSDKLRTCFATPLAGDDDESWKRRAELWRDPRAVIGASDAGAHLDMIATFGYFTDLVGPSVRDRGLLSLEEAVHLITDVPARLYGLHDRGRIATGGCADLVVFDPESVGSDDVVLRNDMPGGESRLYGEANGIEHVFVNGVEILSGRELTGNTPGTVLRSGRDTL